MRRCCRYGNIWDKFVSFVFFARIYPTFTLYNKQKVIRAIRSKRNLFKSSSYLVVIYFKFNISQMEQQSNETQKPSTSNELKVMKREDSLSVVGVELIDSMASNPFVDRVFKAAITMVLFLLFSGLLWCVSKINSSYSDILEQIAVTIFILTLVVFAVSGLVFMCSILLISSNERTDMKTSTADNA